MKDIKNFKKACNDGLKLSVIKSPNQYFVYTDHPYRENINAIDQLLVRAKEYSCS